MQSAGTAADTSVSVVRWQQGGRCLLVSLDRHLTLLMSLMLCRCSGGLDQPLLSWAVMHQTV